MKNPVQPFQPLRPGEDLRKALTENHDAKSTPPKNSGSPVDAPPHPKLGEILVEQGIISGEDLAAMFGLDMAPGAGADPAKPKRAKAKAGKKVPAVPGGRGKVRAKGSAGRRKLAT